ncbi:MAG: pantoate--beta-alanine ligase [Spirosomataceae bacterium]
MHVFSTISALQAYLWQLRLSGKTIGFVPTMGALHQGHLQLVQTAKQENDIVVCSVYVNPTQFNNAHDLAVYPRTLESDSTLLASVACDVLFAPNDAEMYPQRPVLKMDFGNLERVMEGAFRPGHFNGVGIVVSKLFHFVQPTRAYFGQKDLQQCLVVKQLVQDLSFNLELRICPTVREADGLAMSSRNRNLTTEQRAAAPSLYRCLQEAAILLQNNTPITDVKAFVTKTLETDPIIQLEYFEISETTTLTPVSERSHDASLALCIAAFLGKTRLIDNLIL